MHIFRNLVAYSDGDRVVNANGSYSNNSNVIALSLGMLVPNSSDYHEKISIKLFTLQKIP